MSGTPALGPCLVAFACLVAGCLSPARETPTGPGSPEREAPPTRVRLLEIPERVEVGERFTVRWAVESSELTLPHTAVHYGSEPVPHPKTPTAYAAAAGVRQPATAPAEFSAEVTLTLPGAWYFRAHAFDGALHFWSKEVAVDAWGAASALAAPDGGALPDHHAHAGHLDDAYAGPDAFGPPAPAGEASGAPRGSAPTGETLSRLSALFDDRPFIGGQAAPFVAKWVNRDVFLFLQLDSPESPEAAAVRYVGIGVRGTFCEETRPDRDGGSFAHFHRWNATSYAAGHGGPAGAQGYWLSWISAGRFVQEGREIAPGVDYDARRTPAPSCGADAPRASFDAGASALAPEDVAALLAAFGDDPYHGGQRAPRVSLWVNEDTHVFLQFDRGRAANSTALRYLGLGHRGAFCAEGRPSADFAHFHRFEVSEYGKGHGGEPGAAGYWLLAVAVAEFKTQDRWVAPGVDRAFFPTPPPTCDV